MMKTQTVDVLDQQAADEKLLMACLCGHIDAWSHFFYRYKDIIYGAIYATVKRWDHSTKSIKEHSHELFQEIAVALMDDNGRRLKRYQRVNGSAFSSWLRVVVSRLVIDHLRKQRHPAFFVEMDCIDTDMNFDERPDPEKSLSDKEILHFVRLTINKLAPIDRLIMRLIYDTGVTPKNTASIVGLNPGAVYTRVHRIVTAIRQQASEKGLI